ncbi:MAG: metallophosphatase family protein [Proteobacteria bacterium]|nr:metallophosphatase family protein [Pseudomonadota bacterium]MBU1689033.1 metallophosphatase family protein [Pseudomonadota bacterium]
MQIAVIADIHSNFQALTEVLADMDRVGIDHIFSLGDIIGYGPDPQEVCRALFSRTLTMILGNHEYALVKPGYLERLNQSPRRSLLMNIEDLDRRSLDRLAALPKFACSHGARLVHGCPPTSPTAYLMDPSPRLLGKLFTFFPEKICFFGHTHEFALYEDQGGIAQPLEFQPGLFQLTPDTRYIINPGSVGQPRDGLDIHAKYLIWDTEAETILLKSIPYDVRETQKKLRDRHYPDFNAERLTLL